MPPKPRQPEGERKFDSSSALGTLQAQLSREVLKHTATIRVTDGNKNRLKSILESRDAGRAGEIAEIFNTDTNFTAVRNDPGVTAEDVQRLGKFIWAVNGQEKAVVPQKDIQRRVVDALERAEKKAEAEVAAESLPPDELPEREEFSPERIAAEKRRIRAMEEPSAEQQALDAMLEGPEETEAPVVFDLENLPPGLEAMAELGRSVSIDFPVREAEDIRVVPPASMPEMEDEAEVAAIPYLPPRRDAVVLEPVQATQAELSVEEAPREESAPQGKKYDIIPIYAPKPSFGRQAQIRLIDAFRREVFKPEQRMAGGEFRAEVGEFMAGKKDMVAVLAMAEFDEKGETIIAYSEEPTLFYATMPFFLDSTRVPERNDDRPPGMNQLLHPMNAGSIRGERQSDGVVNYTTTIGEMGNRRYLLTYRFIDHATQVGMEPLQMLREDPLEFTVQNVVEVGDYVRILSAYQELGVALASGEQQQIDQAQAAVEQALNTYDISGLEKRALASREILEYINRGKRILDAVVEEKRAIDREWNANKSSTIVGGSLKRPMIVYDVLNIPAEKRPRPNVPRAKYENEMVKRELAQHKIALEAVREAVIHVRALFYRFAPEGEQITNPDYVQDLETLQAFLDSPNYETLNAALQIVEDWSEQVRVQYEKYHLEAEQDTRFEKYEKELGIARLDEDETQVLFQALANVEFGLFSMFEDLVLPHLQNRDPNQRQNVFDLFSNWMEHEVKLLSVSETAVDLIFPYIDELAAVAAADYVTGMRQLKADAVGNFKKLQEQGLLPRLTPEQTVLLTTDRDDLSPDEAVELDELLREFVTKQLTVSKSGAVSLMRNLQNWLSANRRKLELEDSDEIIQLLGNVAAEDPNKRKRGRNNTLFYLMQAHDELDRVLKDNRIAMKGNKNERWAALQEALAEILDDVVVIADLRDGEEDRASNLATVGNTAKVLNRLIDQTKKTIHTQAEAALKLEE